MKRLIFILLSALILNNCFAQTSRDICSAKTFSWSSQPASYTSLTDAKNMLKDIIAVIGLKPNFEIMSANVDNAAAVIYESKRYILYNPNFINRLNTAAGNNWASISILAHEIGHHLNGHTLDNLGSQPEKELEADEFSGFVLRRMGATLAEAQAAMKIAADYKASVTHPGQAARLVAIANGWNTANQQQNGKDLAKVTPPKSTQQPVYKTKNNADVAVNEPTQNNSDLQTDDDNDNATRYPVTRTANTSRNLNGYILADINFKADEAATFYLITGYKVVKIVDNQMVEIGKMTATDSSDYPFIISDDSGTKLWVESTGYIINAGDKRVGFIKVRE